MIHCSMMFSMNIKHVLHRARSLNCFTIINKCLPTIIYISFILDGYEVDEAKTLIIREIYKILIT